MGQPGAPVCSGLGSDWCFGSHFDNATMGLIYSVCMVQPVYTYL